MRTLLILGLAALAWSYHSQSQDRGTIDNSVWDIHIRKDALLTLPHPDTLAFHDGKFISAERLRSGFMPSTYSSQGSSKLQTWTASLDNTKNGVLNWQGKIQEDRIEGTLSWIRNNGRMESFKFSGKRKI